jgi:integrase
VEPLKDGPAGATELTKGNRDKIFEYAWWMRREGYAEGTINRRIRFVKTLVKRGANLFDPDSVKTVIAKQSHWSPTTKEHSVTIYSNFLKCFDGNWNPPRYKRLDKLPFIPSEDEINDLIAGSNRKVATFLQLLKETGMRCGEAWQLEWTDYNFDSNVVRVTPEKGGRARVLKISNKLVAMLNQLSKDAEKPFQGSLRHFARTFRRQRKRVAHKLQNNRISKITFHTFRHWKATVEYHKTKDILHVKQLLGHRSIENTMIYIQLVNFEADEFTCRVANTIKESKELVEAGFDYVTDVDGAKLFRKRK